MDLAPLIVRYAERFAALGDGGEHGVGSPLGAWLALALVAPVSRGAERAELEDALGADATTAHQLLLDLIDAPHPAVATALAAWENGFAGLREWLAALPNAVGSGPVPPQAVVDAWAREHTFGLIEQFPIGVADAVIVLASALATKVTWLTAFDVVDARLLRGPWGDGVSRALRTPAGPRTGHDAFVTDTSRAGPVAVHRARADDGLLVTSVIAQPHVARADVLAAAHEIATATTRPVSLFDLPLGETPLWTITERPAAAGGGADNAAVLPAWHAKSDHRLSGRPGLGFRAGGAALLRAADVSGGVEAKQTAVARFSRTGFAAAAVTALAVAVSMRGRVPGPTRTAVLNFGHPYAVVASVDGSDGVWNRLPVFAAWVTEPEDAE